MENNIRNVIALPIFMLLLLSGCGGRSKKGVQPEPRKNDMAMNMPVGLQDKENPMLVFDDDIEAFVLDDQRENSPSMPLAMTDNQQPLDFEWDRIDNPSTKQMALVYFPYDSCQPRSDQQQNLAKVDALAQTIYQQGDVVCLKGHACKWHGTSAYNLAISQDRSNYLKNHLMHDVHIPESHIRTFGVGNEEPVAFDWSKEGQAPNRRVEVYALKT